MRSSIKIQLCIFLLCLLAAQVACECGDGKYEPSTEECDDGNLVNADGCSATCTLETDVLVLCHNVENETTVCKLDEISELVQVDIAVGLAGTAEQWNKSVHVAYDVLNDPYMPTANGIFRVGKGHMRLTDSLITLVIRGNSFFQNFLLPTGAYVKLEQLRVMHFLHKAKFEQVYALNAQGNMVTSDADQQNARFTTTAITYCLDDNLKYGCFELNSVATNNFYNPSTHERDELSTTNYVIPSILADDEHNRTLELNMSNLVIEKFQLDGHMNQAYYIKPGIQWPDTEKMVMSKYMIIIGSVKFYDGTQVRRRLFSVAAAIEDDSDIESSEEPENPLPDVEEDEKKDGAGKNSRRLLQHGQLTVPQNYSSSLHGTFLNKNIPALKFDANLATISRQMFNVDAQYKARVVDLSIALTSTESSTTNIQNFIADILQNHASDVCPSCVNSTSGLKVLSMALTNITATSHKANMMVLLQSELPKTAYIDTIMASILMASSDLSATSINATTLGGEAVDCSNCDKKGFCPATCSPFDEDYAKWQVIAPTYSSLGLALLVAWLSTMMQEGYQYSPPAPANSEEKQVHFFTVRP